MNSMIAKAVRKQRYKCVAVLVCLLIAANSAHGAVLCFGADGHVEIEPTFHDCGDHSGDTHPAEQKQHSSRIKNAKTGHCGPCVDVPISAGLMKPTRTLKQQKPTFSASATKTLCSSSLDRSVCSSASKTFEAASNPVLLRTVVLLI